MAVRKVRKLKLKAKVSIVCIILFSISIVLICFSNFSFFNSNNKSSDNHRVVENKHKTPKKYSFNS